jgi:hypothetical protein
MNVILLCCLQGDLARCAGKPLVQRLTKTNSDFGIRNRFPERLADSVLLFLLSKVSMVDEWEGIRLADSVSDMST